VTIGPKFRAGREIEAKTFGRHLQALRHHLLLNDKRLAERLGISPNAVRNWESGGSLPSDENVQKVLAIAENEADPDWLLSGRGTIPEWVKQNHIEISDDFVIQRTPRPRVASPPAARMTISDGDGSINVSVANGTITIDADTAHYRVEVIEGGVKVVRI